MCGFAAAAAFGWGFGCADLWAAPLAFAAAPLACAAAPILTAAPLLATAHIAYAAPIAFAAPIASFGCGCW